MVIDLDLGPGRSTQKWVNTGNSSPGRLRRVDGEAARRQAVQQVLSDGAEVARALEHQELVPDLLVVDLIAQPEAGERQRNLAQAGGRGAHVEHRRRRDHVLGHAVLDRRHRDHRLQVEAGAQQLEPERHAVRAPDTRVRIEVNAAVLLGAQLVQPGRQCVALRDVGHRCTAPGLRQHGIEGKSVGSDRLDRRRRRLFQRRGGSRGCHGERQR